MNVLSLVSASSLYIHLRTCSNFVHQQETGAGSYDASAVPPNTQSEILCAATWGTFFRRETVICATHIVYRVPYRYERLPQYNQKRGIVRT